MGLLRIFLALAVVIEHIGPYEHLKFMRGMTAVKIFFVISGFYMTLIWNEKYSLLKGGYKLFLTNRLLRLFPTYYVILIFSVLLPFGLSFLGRHYGFVYDCWTTHVEKLTTFSKISLFLINLSIIGIDLFDPFGVSPSDGTFKLLANSQGNLIPSINFVFIGPAWSLGVELWFYMMAPRLVNRSIKTIGALLAILVFFKIALIDFVDVTHGSSDSLLPFELCYFMAGAFSYQIYSRLPTLSWFKPLYHKILIALILSTTFFYWYLPINTKLPVYVTLLTLSLPSLFLMTKNNKIDRLIGELSYPVYLSHFVLVPLAKRLSLYTGLHETSLLIGLTLLVSVALYYFIDRNVESYRQKRVRDSFQKVNGPALTESTGLTKENIKTHQPSQRLHDELER